MLFGLKKFISFWLMPLSLFVAATAAGLWLMRKPQRARLGRTLIVTALILLVILSNNLVSKWLMRPLEARYPAIPEVSAGTFPPALASCPYVVVLGGGNGFTPGVPAVHLLSTSALGRITEAVRLMRVLPDARLIVSGPRGKQRESHATVLARAAISLGVAPGRIVHIDQAHDTEDEANAVRRIVGDAPVALVTSAWHMPRSMALFRHAGVKATACPADYQTHTQDPVTLNDLAWESRALDRSTLAVRERIGYLWIWLRGKS